MSTPEKKAAYDKCIALVNTAVATAEAGDFTDGKDDARLFDVLLPVQEWFRSDSYRLVYREIINSPEWKVFTQVFKQDLLGRNEATLPLWDAAKERRDKKVNS